MSNKVRVRSRAGKKSAGRYVVDPRSQDPVDINVKKRECLRMLSENGGIITPVMKKLGLARQTYYDWISNDPVFAQSAKDIKEIAIDFVEGKLMKNINKERESSIFFYLKCQAKHRGYVERQELEHSGRGGGPIEIEEKPSEKSVVSMLEMINKRKQESE
jgi:hypothetical protein